MGSIANDQFSGCTGLTSLTSPDSIGRIGIGAFGGCTGLTYVSPDQFAVHFQSIPGRSYEIQSSDALGGAWITAASATATTTQKRVLLGKPTAQRFYRVVIP